MAMSWLSQQRMGVGKGKGAGTGKGKGSKGKDRRAIAAEIKSNPRWIPAVTNFCFNEPMDAEDVSRSGCRRDVS